MIKPFRLPIQIWLLRWLKIHTSQIFPELLTHERNTKVEQALVDHVQGFLLEMGTGFAFVGRQVFLEAGDRDFSIDRLFYHLKLRLFVVVELKAVSFDPAFVEQLNRYLSADDDLCQPRVNFHHYPSRFIIDP